MVQKSPGAVAVSKKSVFRPDNSGGRKDIRLTPSLESLKAGPSSEQFAAAATRPPSGPTRSRTPVDSVAPSHRSTSTSKSADTQVVSNHIHDGGLPDDDSLVLYKDPSELTAQDSMGSVVSGRHQQGDIFFTALRRNYSAGLKSELADHEKEETLGGGLSYMSSQLNPMQSPTTSSYFSVAGDHDADELASSLQDEYSRAAGMAAAEASYASGLDNQASHAAAQGDELLMPTLSVMDIISSLYNSTGFVKADDSHQQQQHCSQWHGLDHNSRPLIQHSQAVDPVGKASATAPKMSEAAGTSGLSQAGEAPASSDDDNAQQMPTSTDAQGQASQTVGSQTDADANSPAADAADAGAINETSQDDHSSRMFMTAVDGQTKAAPEGVNPLDSSNEQQQAQAPADDSSNRTVAGDEQAQAEIAHPTQYLAEVDGLLSHHCKVAAELSGYIQELTSRADEAGQQLLDMPADYALMVERMLRDRRNQYQSLEGWEGPHRFDELPVAQLPICHDDPRVAAGLDQIRQLDEQLKEVWLKAVVAARGSAPEHWAEADRRRLARRAVQLDEALTKERQKRLHAARLLRAFRKLDGQEDDLAGKGLSSYSYYKLQLQEEQVLAAVLARNEASLELHNPFDASQIPLQELFPDDGDGDMGHAHTCQCLAKIPETTTPGAVMAQSAATAAAQRTADTSAASLIGTNATATPIQPDIDRAAVSTEPSAGGSQHHKPSTANSLASAFSGMSVATAGRPKHTLAEIDALLEAMHAGDWQLQRDSSSVSTAAGRSSSSHSVGSCRRSSQQAAAEISSASLAQQTTLQGNPSSSSVCQVAASSAANGDIAAAQRDYVREQREARELMQRDREVDAQLRALRTSELPSKLEPQQLQALLQECRQLQQHATVECV